MMIFLSGCLNFREDTPTSTISRVLITFDIEYEKVAQLNLTELKKELSALDFNVSIPSDNLDYFNNFDYNFTAYRDFVHVSVTAWTSENETKSARFSVHFSRKPPDLDDASEIEEIKEHIISESDIVLDACDLVVNWDDEEWNIIYEVSR